MPQSPRTDLLSNKGEAPGPGAYITETPRKIMGGVIGAGEKYEKIKESSPGPAKYTPDVIRISLAKLPSAVMPRSPRTDLLTNKAETPGPGAYTPTLSATPSVKKGYTF